MSKLSTPYPVPNNIRTSKLGPRLIAGAVIVLWLLVLWWGLRILYQAQASQNSVLDELFSQENVYWGAQAAKSSGKCVAFFQTSFNTTGNSKKDTGANKARMLKIRGAFRFQIFSSVGLAQLKIQAEFLAEGLLAKLRGQINSKLGTLVFETEDKTSTLRLSFFVDEQIKNSLELPFPHPVYLYRQHEKGFRLKLPSDSSFSGNSLFNLNAESSYSVFRLNQLDFEDCQTQVLEWKQKNSSQLFDLGRYLLPFGITEQSGITKVLSEPEEIE